MQINKIEMNTEALRRDRRQLRDYLKRTKNSKQELQEEVEELNAMWEGAANQAFNQQFQVDMQKLDSLFSDFDKYLEELKEAGAAYDKCEAEVGELIRSLNI